MRKKVVFLPRNINTVLARQSLQFPIQHKKMTDEETKEYHRKKLLDLSLKTVRAVLWLDEPNEDQKEWVLFRLSHSNTWPNVHENKIGDSVNLPDSHHCYDKNNELRKVIDL